MGMIPAAEVASFSMLGSTRGNQIQLQSFVATVNVDWLAEEGRR